MLPGEHGTPVEVPGSATRGPGISVWFSVIPAQAELYVSRLDRTCTQNSYPPNFLRNSIFWILPVAVCGNSSTISTASGIHHLAILPSR